MQLLKARGKMIGWQGGDFSCDTQAAAQAQLVYNEHVSCLSKPALIRVSLSPAIQCAAWSTVDPV
jgi:hypothetical protein